MMGDGVLAPLEMLILSMEWWQRGGYRDGGSGD